MERFAWIPGELICRFGELTKTEIIVLTYLYLSRNQKTRQCNPSRAAIGRAVGIAKSHVSKAVGGLEDKEWICEMPDGNFLLTEPGERVTESVTPKVTKSVTQGLRNPSPKVTKSVTKGYEIGNPYIKDIEQTRNNELNRGVEHTPALAIYFETFPTQSINLWQQECITDRVSDLDRWRRAAVLWKTNGWNARNVANLLDYYDKLDEREKKYGKPIQNFREQRSQEKIADRNLVDAARRRIAEADAKLLGQDVGDCQRQLRTISPESNNGRKSLTG